jgi:hypothetical protein
MTRMVILTMQKAQKAKIGLMERLSCPNLWMLTQRTCTLECNLACPDAFRRDLNREAENGINELTNLVDSLKGEPPGAELDGKL